MGSKALLVAWGHEFVDEVLDALGDIEMEVVVGKPTADQWRQAPLVLVDGRCQTLAAGLPAHPRMMVVAPEKLDGERLAAAYHGWRAEYPDAVMYHLPDGGPTIRQMVSTAAASGRPAEMRIGVVGGHGGAGATTLAVALALVAARQGRRTLLVDAAGRGGVDDRLGTPADELRVIDEPEHPASALDQHAAEVKVVDLDRGLPAGQLAAARQCDLVLLLGNAQRNPMAVRRAAARLAGAGARFVLMPAWADDAVALALADEFRVRLAHEVPLDPPSIFSDGRVYLVSGCPLLHLAEDLLRHVPHAAARVAA